MKAAWKDVEAQMGFDSIDVRVWKLNSALKFVTRPIVPLSWQGAPRPFVLWLVVTPPNCPSTDCMIGRYVDMAETTAAAEAYYDNLFEKHHGKT